jgi:uncharacterized membrane protein YccF (DUF307 family)
MRLLLNTSGSFSRACGWRSATRSPRSSASSFALWPFGKTVVKRPDAGIASGIGNVIWFVFCGWWLAILHLIGGLILCITARPVLVSYSDT